VSTAQTATTAATTHSTTRFYLDLSSPIVDAPSIGPRGAEQLNAIGIQTVNDFLRSNAATVATQLDDKRVTAATILDWQNQATLVCRVPNLRGHDAQQLVAAGVTTAEQLASANIASLVNKVVTYASSKAGQRVLRGATVADEAEVRDWIRWAASSRTLRAA
jgi:nucleotidyltransferase/DNA polymerase involved in DNA repair